MLRAPEVNMYIGIGVVIFFLIAIFIIIDLIRKKNRKSLEEKKEE